MAEDKMFVLMVEDDLVLRNVAGKYLSQKFNAVCVMNGHSARAETAKQVPDAILIDIMLPDIDGFQLLEGWRQDEKFDNTAMIMFTNLSETFDRTKAEELGADAYYIKADVDVAELPTIIEKHIKKRRKKGWFS